MVTSRVTPGASVGVLTADELADQIGRAHTVPIAGTMFVSAASGANGEAVTTLRTLGPWRCPQTDGIG